MSLLVLLVCMCGYPSFGKEGSTVTEVKAPNLVPEKPASAPNYWCTWYAQNYWINYGKDMKSLRILNDQKDLKTLNNENARDTLNDHTLFNKTNGWATTYLPRGRQDYIFLIDHGWQTKDRSKRLFGEELFFTFVADEDDFPRYKGLNPGELLKKFNEEIKALGWNSLGLWFRGNLSLEQAREYVKWSKYAGITYWKIDGGDTSNLIPSWLSRRFIRNWY
jgi:hypothetical protein